LDGKVIIHTDNSKMPRVELPVKGTIL